MTHTIEEVAQLVGAGPAQVEKWVRILKGPHPRPLTEEEAVAVAATESFRKLKLPRKKLERLFARLALQPPAGTDWLVVRRPRHDPEVIEAPASLDLSEKRTFVGAVFDPAEFLEQLRPGTD